MTSADRSQVTVKDGDAMRAALVRYLTACSIEDVEDRDLLLRMTEAAPSWIDPNGALHVGGWLFTGGAEPTLGYRMLPRARAMRVYVATLLHERDAWAILTLESERVSLTRTDSE